MKRYFVGILAAVLALAGLNGFAAYAEGEDAQSGEEVVVGNSLRMTPIGVRLRLTAGETLQGDMKACQTSVTDSCSVEVTNVGNNKFSYKVNFTPYSIVDNENNAQFTEGQNASYTQIARWLQVRDKDGVYRDEATFTIEPGETQEIYYRIQVPDDIPGGSQYAVLWAQILNDNANGGGIQTAGQVGSTIIGRSTGESNEVAELSDVKMSRFALGGELKASAKVKNEGNTDFDIVYNYKVTTLLGKEIYNEPPQQTLAFPGIEYEPTITWSEAPMLGIFHSEFTITAADKTETIRHIVVIMPLFAIILLILLLTVVITWIIIIIRKRKEHKARKLV